MPGANIPQTQLVPTVVIDCKDQWTPVDPAEDLLKSQDWRIRFQRQCLPDLSMGDGRTDVHVNARDLPVAVTFQESMDAQRCIELFDLFHKDCGG
jgi:hypothetical protein